MEVVVVILVLVAVGFLYYGWQKLTAKASAAIVGGIDRTVARDTHNTAKDVMDASIRDYRSTVITPEQARQLAEYVAASMNIKTNNSDNGVWLLLYFKSMAGGVANASMSFPGEDGHVAHFMIDNTEVSGGVTNRALPKIQEFWQHLDAEMQKLDPAVQIERSGQDFNETSSIW